MISLFLPCLHRLQEDAEEDEGDAEVEGEVDLAALAEDEEGEDDGIAGFKVIRQIDGEGREAFQGLDLQEIHGYGAEQCVAEHQPKVRTFRDDCDRLLAGEEPQINGDDGRDDDEAARHLIHQHRAAANPHAGLLVADGIEGADG